jgi:hypothetical protein
MPDSCSNCSGLLIEIDHYGERLVGCIECNGGAYHVSLNTEQRALLIP